MEMTAQQRGVGEKQAAGAPKHPTTWIIAVSCLVLIGGTLFLYSQVSWQQALLYVLGAFGGFVLYQAHFGFTSAWRKFILYRQGEGIRAQMIMMAVASALFLPLLVKGSIFGHAVAGNVHDVGLAVMIGAFIFGIGMQLGDGCASGTLYHIGGGDANGIVTLIGFIAGSVIATTHFDVWTNMPHVDPISLLAQFGAFGGFVLQLVLLAVVYYVVTVMEKRRHGQLIAAPLENRHGWKVIYKGPWSLLVGALLLAVMNVLVLMVKGSPWGITSAFALWGAKFVQLFGVDPTAWAYWQDEAKRQALANPLYYDKTTVMDISLMFGALLAAALAGRYTKPVQWKRPTRMTVGALIGGLMMGYGARLAFGCNIGAYFSGIASFSVHGWVWFVFAFLGSLIGVKLRPYCAYKN
ncbi:membrane protein [Geobacillus genomosp. 3]|uniref:Membrane protein n=1 Tax=Geobacillus genomosp. 3 TaxID=1921421 RepID=S5ZMS1_GEOG3|nr:YeeE/YedE family protein [Geobacillus genomosp. 3]AGT31683.1 membrane protein [Geobacillus genomosp. 3]